jgi:hypothetical protein
MDEPWARVGLRIGCDLMSADEISVLLGLANLSQSEDRWIADLPIGSKTPLAEQMVFLHDFIGEHLAAFRQLRATDICICIGWTPHSPQDGILIHATLISMLAELNAYVLLDTYLDY